MQAPGKCTALLAADMALLACGTWGLTTVPTAPDGVVRAIAPNIKPSYMADVVSCACDNCVVCGLPTLYSPHRSMVVWV